MNKFNLLRLMITALFLALGYGTMLINPQYIKAQDNSDYAPVNGLEMYYEIYGEGNPLILIHGGLGGTVEFSSLIPYLAESHRVIAVELQGHGHTADIDRPLTYENLADDIATLIDYLGYEHANIMGYSLGGGVALQTAIRHPEAVNKLVLVSTPFARNGIHPEFLMGMEAMNAESAQMMLETPMYGLYSAVAPRSEDWARLVGKVGDLLREDYDWSEDIISLTTPTLIIIGDSDMLPPEHAVEMFELLGGSVPGGFAEAPSSRLLILPAITHFDILADANLPLMVSVFLTSSQSSSIQN